MQANAYAGGQVGRHYNINHFALANLRAGKGSSEYRGYFSLGEHSGGYFNHREHREHRDFIYAW